MSLKVAVRPFKWGIDQAFMLTQPTTTLIFSNYLGVCKANASSVKRKAECIRLRSLFGHRRLTFSAYVKNLCVRWHTVWQKTIVKFSTCQLMIIRKSKKNMVFCFDILPNSLGRKNSPTLKNLIWWFKRLFCSKICLDIKINAQKYKLYSNIF